MNAHWTVKRLDEIFEIARGGSPRPIEKFLTNDSTGLNWVKIGDATASGKFIKVTKEKIKPEGLAKSRFVSSGDFLLTNSMSFGRPYIMATDGCIHDGWLVLKPHDHKLVDQNYFYHLLGSDSIYEKFSARASGSTVKNLNTDIVSSVEIKLPPLDEQRRIAAILDKADALRRKRKRTLDLLDSLTESIFRNMFGDLASNSKGWGETEALGHLADIASGITKGRKLSDEVTREVPYLAVSNVQDKFLDLSVVKKIHASENEIQRYRLRANDLLLTEGGDPDKLGRGTLWADELRESIHQNHIFRVRVNSPKATPTYLIWLIGSPYGKAYFLRSAKQTTGIASINKRQLSDFPVVLPPIRLQAEFEQRAHSVRRVLQTSSLNRISTDLLFSSLQSRAFSGQL